MGITPITSNNNYIQTSVEKTESNKKSAATEEAKNSTASAIAQKTDSFTKTSNTTNTEAVNTYKNRDKLSADELKVISDQRIASFQNMLKSMVAKQGEKYNLSIGGQKFNVSLEDSMKAASAIAEGGEWSVNSVATNIMDMAKALSGGDSSKLSMLREAVEKGFKEAEKQWGGKLPSICNDTHDEVMKRFDDWENEVSGKTSELISE